MLYSTIQKIDRSDYINKLETECFDVLDEIENGRYEAARFVLNSGEGHSDIHEENNIAKDLLRMIRDNVPANGSFSDKKTALDNIINAIIYNAEDITDWIQSTPNDKFAKESSYNRLVLTSNMHSDTGMVYTKDYKEHTSRGITLVLDRDKSNRSPYGFYVTTAYPSLEFSAPTGRTFEPREIALADLGYKDAAERIFAFARANDSIKTYILENSTIKARFELNNKYKKLDMFVNPDKSIRYREFEIGKSFQYLSEQETRQKYPKESRLFDEIKKISEEIWQRESEKNTERILTSERVPGSRQ